LSVGDAPIDAGSVATANRPVWKRAWFWTWLVSVPLLIVGANRWLDARRESLPVLGTLPAWSLVDQDATPYGRDRLEGHVTVVNFIFTLCPTVCPVLTARMRDVQKATEADGAGIRLLSISVDPGTDTPEVLTAYASKFGRDPARWDFLTGPYEAVEKVVVDGFHQYLGREPRDAGSGEFFDIVHGEKFVLVDASGRLRGFYDTSPDELARLVRHARALANGTVRDAKN